MDQDDRTLAQALSNLNRYHSPPGFVRDVFSLLRDPVSLDQILAQVPPRYRARIVRQLHSSYGPHVEVSETGWCMSAGAHTDPEGALRRHEAHIAHAVHVATPAIRAWLAAHPDELT